MVQFFNDFLGVVTKVSFLEKYFLIIAFLLAFYNFISLLTERNIIKTPQRWINLAFFANIKNLVAVNFFKIFGKRLLVNLALVVFLFLGLFAYLQPLPKVVYPKGPSMDFTEVSFEKPLVIKFDRLIEKNKVSYEIIPKIEGEWAVGHKSISFKPFVSTQPEERYTISLKNVNRFLGSSGYDYSFSFKAPPAPLVKEASISQGQDGVLPSQEITLIADLDHEKIAKFEFEISPPVEIAVVKDGLSYKVSAPGGFKKGTDYELKVLRTVVSFDYIKNKELDAGEKEEIYRLAFKTIDAPGVRQYSPKGVGVITTSPFLIEFGQDMDINSVAKNFVTEPKIEGNIFWEGLRVLNFAPTNPLLKNTKYKVTVLKQASLVDGSTLDDDFSFEFTTIGYVGVASVLPANNAKNIDKNTNISVAFNQPVDKESAQAKFLISPEVKGGFLWENNTLIFKPVGLDHNKTYQIKILAGVKSVYGLDSVNDFSSIFTTKEQSIMLNVPAYKQTYLYSCMASASRSALAYKGVSVTEKNLLDLMGYDNTPWSGTWRDPNSTWGDPNKGVVGDLTGKADPGWGYGAHWGPTAKAISAYRPAEIKTGWTVEGIAAEISNGNPVVVWWVNGVWPAFEVYWKNNGVSIRAVNSMHVQVVKGFTGSADNPTSFTVTDSGYYYPQQTFNTATFKAKWSWFGNTAVVVK